MSFRLILLCLAVLVCALWPQGLVLCVGDRGHLDLEPGGARCCPEEKHEPEERQGGEEEDDCGGCRDFDSPELTAATAPPAFPAPICAANFPGSSAPPALALDRAFDGPPRLRCDTGLLTVVLVI